MALRDRNLFEFDLPTLDLQLSLELTRLIICREHHYVLLVA